MVPNVPNLLGALLPGGMLENGLFQVIVAGIGFFLLVRWLGGLRKTDMRSANVDRASDKLVEQLQAMVNNQALQIVGLTARVDQATRDSMESFRMRMENTALIHILETKVKALEADNARLVIQMRALEVENALLRTPQMAPAAGGTVLVTTNTKVESVE